MTNRLEDLCKEKGLKMTGQRRLIARVLSESTDHPDVETLFQRAARRDPNISIATVYRTVHLFEEVGVLERHVFGDGKARYEERPESHHDHLIDVRSGAVVEFKNEAIEKMQEAVARELGYKLIGHRLELYAVPSGKAEKAKTAPVIEPAEKTKIT
ncbi:MAG TPA: Fur family transcriptional regulator [Stellaceae bacterium]|nr:Fur family transcriptional regulator [Stellaceae bacterium]